MFISLRTEDKEILFTKETDTLFKLIEKQENVNEGIKECCERLKDLDPDVDPECMEKFYNAVNKLQYSIFTTIKNLMGFGSDVEVTNVVCQTMNLDMFEKINGNRDVVTEGVTRLTDSMGKFGQIIPIMVNEKMEVIDGQHRLQTRRLMNSDPKYKKEPIRFIVKEGLTLNHVVGVNTVVRRWNLVDFIASHAQTNKACAELKKIIDENKFLKSACLMSITIGSFSSSCNKLVVKVIENDLLDEQSIVRTKKILPILKEIMDDPNARAFFSGMQHADKLVNAMTYMIEIEGYNPARFRNALAKAARSDRSHYSSSGFGDCLDTMQAVYNATRGKKRTEDLKANYKKYQANLKKSINKRYEEKMAQYTH